MSSKQSGKVVRISFFSEATFTKSPNRVGWNLDLHYLKFIFWIASVKVLEFQVYYWSYFLFDHFIVSQNSSSTQIDKYSHIEFKYARINVPISIFPGSPSKDYS
ncbi:hypothetical protein OCU04_003117 [Sclerotinia nivalis]|uniref:Uncharacterized protein n=1 Tax=Sclerotinia nivalis TaxID=352851 RepID=A0A9X0AYF3_9HELO|nr:hypothetical protein OCU04_003117 [Sclerotinia nivalis]